MCQGGSSSLRRFRKGTGLPAETYPNRLDSIFLQGTVSQLQGVFSPETRVQEVHGQARRGRIGMQETWMQAWEYQEWSQGAGMRKSGSNLGMDTWRLERRGSSCLIRDGVSQACGEARHPNAFT